MAPGDFDVSTLSLAPGGRNSDPQKKAGKRPDAASRPCTGNRIGYASIQTLWYW